MHGGLCNDILAGEKPDKGAFKCNKCVHTQNLFKKTEILKTYLQCGGDSFEGSLIFERTLAGLKEKYDELITSLFVQYKARRNSEVKLIFIQK